MLAYVKAGAAIAALAASFTFGHWVASKAGDAELNKAKAEFAAERVQWNQERLAITDKAAKDLADQVAKAADKEGALKEAYRQSESKYVKRIKELEGEFKKLNSLVTDVSDTGGLWINVEARSCPTPGQLGPSANLSQATVGADRPPETLRCRIAREDSRVLLEIGYTSDSRTELLNKCIATLNSQSEVLDPPKPATNPTDNTK